MLSLGKWPGDLGRRPKTLPLSTNTDTYDTTTNNYSVTGPAVSPSTQPGSSEDHRVYTCMQTVMTGATSLNLGATVVGYGHGIN